MKKIKSLSLLSLVVFGMLLVCRPALAWVKLGTANASLIGGDITDPEDKVVDPGNCSGGGTEEQMKPSFAGWGKMNAAPIAPPYQMHPYQSWQNSPACAIFLNRPQDKRWYVGFKDGGSGGPTEDEPYYCAVELKEAYVLTHFTLTSSPGAETERDPLAWGIQGSNSGEDDDWTDIYRCDAKDRSTTPVQAAPRCETTLFTSFTSANMAKGVSPADLKKLQAKLKDQKIEKADFENSGKAYTWFRVVIYSCFNANTMAYADFNHPPGFELGQIEFFGIRGTKTKSVPKPRPVVESIKPEAYDPAFIISYWCGPPKSETTLERYKELADCGFTVAYAAIDNLWSPADKAQEEHNLKVLDLCQKVGLKALIWDGNMLKVGGFDKAPTPQEIPQIEKVLDGMIAKYSSHPAFLGFIEGDEGITYEGNHRLGVVNQYLLKKDPKHLPYFNLLPAYAFNPLSDYDKYVSKFIEDAKPAMVSWDHYRQMFEGGDERTYWYNLELMRKLCVKARIPYNQIIVSLKHMGYRECSEVDLRWQVYSSLAYGSRGIQYFTYWFTDGLAWADAPSFISKEGKRDVKWDYASKINHRIGKLGPTLVKLTSTGAYGTDPIMPGMRRLSSHAPVKKAEGGPMVIGCFQDASKKQYVMVMNRSFNAKITAKLTLDQRITSAAEISQETGKLLAAKSMAGKLLEVELEPGEGRLFSLPETGLLFNPPDEIIGGDEIDLTNIQFEPEKADANVTGKLFWRAKGETQFAGLPLHPTEKNHFKVTLPVSATKGPFEYYIEMQEEGQKPVTEPEAGAKSPLLATPDLTPPTAVGELAAPVVKSYRVTLAWKPATDDRAVTEYRVYRGSADKFPLNEQALVTKLSAPAGEFTDDAPTPKQTAWYAVQAIDAVWRKGEVRYLQVDVPDNQPPANALKVQASAGSKSVSLTWSGELEPNVTTLEIHRGEGKDGALQKIGEVTDMSMTRYIDKDAKYGTEYRYDVRPRSNAGLLGDPGQVVTATPLSYLKRINCGGPEVIPDDGIPWEADKNPPHPGMRSASTSVWVVPNPINGTGPLKNVYQDERWASGHVKYAFEVEPGRYEVVLLFAETNPTYFEKGKRTFDIVVNGQKLAEKVDIFTEAGGSMTAWEFRKEVVITGRELKVGVIANPTGPAIKGIEIRGLPPK